MAAGLHHPERVAGFHFFNPVAVMPLLEIVPTASTNNAALATAFVLGKTLKKTIVLTRDATAFVVNRVLLRLMGEVIHAFDEGTPAETADNALKPMGLPMTPFTLLAMIGIPVAQHVTESLHAAFGDRFPVSTNQQKLIDRGIKGIWVIDEAGQRSVPQSVLDVLEFGTSPATSEELFERIQIALAEEIRLLLNEGVVAAPEDVDLCMITGAGWPLHLGGITPYLDRTGASVRANGKPFHPGRY
jgi:3-hydroxyacyl-CoA dehydrogenase